MDGKHKTRLLQNFLEIAFVFIILIVNGCDKDEDYYFHVKVLLASDSIPIPDAKVIVKELETGILSSSTVLNTYSSFTDKNGDCVLLVRYQRYSHIFFTLSVNGEFKKDPSGSTYFFHEDRYLKEDDFRKTYYLLVE